mmetsp:Transcript_29362/g.94717  ORF Transcript_29362/g.94717 Transcript_29362/m.94717 type:complete len:208 (-) Transcript_29362:4185-4808(-)
MHVSPRNPNGTDVRSRTHAAHACSCNCPIHLSHLLQPLSHLAKVMLADPANSLCRAPCGPSLRPRKLKKIHPLTLIRILADTARFSCTLAREKPRLVDIESGTAPYSAACLSAAACTCQMGIDSWRDVSIIDEAARAAPDARSRRATPARRRSRKASSERPAVPRAQVAAPPACATATGLSACARPSVAEEASTALLAMACSERIAS